MYPYKSALVAQKLFDGQFIMRCGELNPEALPTNCIANLALPIVCSLSSVRVLSKLVRPVDRGVLDGDGHPY